MAAAARAAWLVDVLPWDRDVELRVTQYSERRVADRDNLIKPIQDTLQGIAYRNDRQVLALAFSSGDEFLHIRVWPSPDTEDLG